MSKFGWLLVFGALGTTAIGTELVRRYALRVRLLDEPNARSSHTVPTPRGGGLAIVAVCVLNWIALYVMGLVEVRLVLALSLGGLAVAAVGFLDDRKGVDARIRLMIHLMAATLAIAVLFASTGPDVRTGEFGYPWLRWVLAVLGIAWFLNLFNFMDGIDGIACSEAAFISLGGAFLHLLSGGSAGEVFSALVVGGAALGFLYWNYPPAKVFMGDVGSGFLGYVLAVLAVSSAQGNMSALFPWLTLAAVFLADSGVTVLRRALRGERVYLAHRTHAYQWLARRWLSHRRVTIIVMAINLFYLLPLAGWASVRPQIAGRVFLVGIVPLVIAAALAGAGRQEEPVSGRA
jgi:Fuc2NAc and GlcNAc transferase